MLTVRGLLLALSLTVSVPVAEPLADGLNVTLKFRRLTRLRSQTAALLSKRYPSAQWGDCFSA